MSLILFDDHSWDNLLPLTFTRPVSGLRVGILTIREKWERELGATASFITREHLAQKYSCALDSDNLLINGSLLPDAELVKAISALESGQGLKKGDILLGVRLDQGKSESFTSEDLIDLACEYDQDVCVIDYPWKVFSLNGQEIRADFERIIRGRKSETLSKTVQVFGSGQIFVEAGFKGEYITLNSSNGPIYLGQRSEIMEGTTIRGPFALGEGAVIKMNAKIYGDTSIGPYSKVGGEITNSVILGNTNKAHDGFLGNSVIGEWCNLGADTNNSNLKNNYAVVKIWNYLEKKYINTGRQFCGLIMGDHSKSGINTMFNTGTVVGVSANIFGEGFPRTFIPSFSWGGAGGFTTYRIEKVIETAALVMSRRDMDLTQEDKSILKFIYGFSEQYRNFP